MKDFLNRIYRQPTPFKVEVSYIGYRVLQPRRMWQMPNRTLVYRHPFDVSVAEMKYRLGTNNDLADIRLALHNDLLVIHDRQEHADGTKEQLTLELTDRGLSYIGRNPIVTHS